MARPPQAVGDIIPGKAEPQTLPEMAGGIASRPDREPVASIRRPQAEVGGVGGTRGEKSILDVILGN